jgi:hypothetical protein
MDDTNTPDLDTTIAHLEAVELGLIAIDSGDLSKEERNQLADLLHVCTTNLTWLRNADLQSLTNAFKAREPELRSAAGRLEKEVQNLNDAADVIRAVSTAVETITNIVALVV